MKLILGFANLSNINILHCESWPVINKILKENIGANMFGSGTLRSVLLNHIVNSNFGNEISGLSTIELCIYIYIYFYIYIYICIQRSLHRATDATFVPRYAKEDVIRSGHLQYDTLYADNEIQVEAVLCHVVLVSCCAMLCHFMPCMLCHVVTCCV